MKNQPGVNGVKNIIAISSGKGGVGKIFYCRKPGAGPGGGRGEGGHSGCRYLWSVDSDHAGCVEDSRPTSPDGTHMAPIMKYGLATNSIGYLVTDDNAMVWRGPMASKALMQMLQETLWPDLDYLVLDRPPGTPGDIQLTLAQNIPVTGAVVVTTPQDIALIDAKKGIVMFEKVEVPVLGDRENMSMHICSNCGHHEPIFGTGGAQKLARNTTPSCWASCRCILRCGKIWITARRRWWRVRQRIYRHLPRQLAGRVAAQMYWQGEVIPVRLPSAPFKAAASASASISPSGDAPWLRWSSHDAGRSAGRFYFPSGTSAFRWR